MAKVVSFNLDAALVEGVLSKGSRRVTCQEVRDATAISARPPHLVVLSGDAGAAAGVAEAVVDDAGTLATTLVAWRVRGRLSDVSRLVALGVRVVEGDEDALRAACDEALDAHDNRTIRVDPEKTEPPTSPDALELHGRRVIVADDDPAIIWFFADLLRAQGCDVEEATDGVTALDLARRSMPDLIVSDIRMPRLDGIRLTRALRADPLLADVPLLLLSWKEDWLDDAQRQGVDASAYLPKRSTPEEVLARVLEVLGPHARFERTLRGSGRVEGRLQGSSPYRLLRLACASHPDSRLTLRCGPKTYEVQVRSGAPRDATCMGADGPLTRSTTALDSLLAEREGSFTLGPEVGAVDGELIGTLHQQIASCVARVRRAWMPTEAPTAARPAAPAMPVQAAPLPPPVPLRALAPIPPPVVLAPRPQPQAQSQPRQPTPPASSLAPVARSLPERTLPLRTPVRPKREAAPSKPEVAPPAPRALSLRWIGLAAVAILGLVLGAGARALRHTDVASQAQARAAGNP